MNNLEYNKIAAALLIALLVGKVSGLTSGALIHPENPTKPILKIDVVEDSASAVAGPTGPAPIEPLLAGASIERGKEIAKKCLTCHTFEKGAPSKIGPNLWGTAGNKLGHMAGFAYSSVLTAKGGMWTFDNLNHMLYKPQTFIPGTKMSFAGLKDTQERADVIAYMNSMSDNPLPLPPAGAAPAAAAPAPAPVPAAPAAH